LWSIQISEFTVSEGEIDPVATLFVIASHISLAISIEISPVSHGAWMTAPVFKDQSGTAESTVSIGEVDPVITLGVITDHVSLAVTVDISP